MGIFGKHNEALEAAIEASRRAQTDQLYAQSQAQAMQYGGPAAYQNAFMGPMQLYTQAGLQAAGTSAQQPKKELEQEEIICATGALVGRRAWNVALFRDQLQSFNGAVWPIKQKLVAVCNASVCGGQDCGCGIYSWKPKYEGRSEGRSNTTTVKGEVWLWGMVIECEQGYRAQFAYPKAFVDTGLLARKAAKIYGVELIKA